MTSFPNNKNFNQSNRRHYAIQYATKYKRIFLKYKPLNDKLNLH